MSAERKKDKFTSFGQMLKHIRVQEANIGLRRFAGMIGMQPSNLSNIEQGRIAPPATRKQLDLMCDTLGLSQNDNKRTRLFDLAAEYSQNRIPADVADTIKNQVGVPVLVRTVANKQLSEKKLRELANYIKDNF